MSPEMSPVAGFNQLRRIESSTLFQGVVIAIIILSALTIGAKTYDLPPLVEQSLSMMDIAITLFFLIEILFRFAASPVKRRFLLDGLHAIQQQLEELSKKPNSRKKTG